VSKSQTEAAEEDRVRSILTKYRRLGFLDTEPLDVYKFHLPVKEFHFDVTSRDATAALFTSNMKQMDTLLNLSFSDYAKLLSKIFVKGTEFEDKVNVNSEPDPSSINLYFLTKDPDRLLLGSPITVSILVILTL
jgi:hypothetical protein